MTTSEDRAAIREALQKIVDNANEIATSTGGHAGHTPRQVGRCVYCTCGDRYQGWLHNGRKDPRP